MNPPGSHYPGNTALSPEVRQRVETTYRQSRELAERGNRQEASLGCDFVLQLDPDYLPAQELLALLESGKPIPAESTAAEPSPSTPSLDIDDLGDAFADLDPPAAPAGPQGPATGGVGGAAEATGSGDDLADRLGALIAARRHAEAVELAQQAGDRIAGDPRLTELARTATDRHEAAPYVERFVAAARQARAQGDEDATRTNLEKARALDPGHPELAALAAGTSTVAGPPRQPPGEPAPVTDSHPPKSEEPPAIDDPFGDLGGNEDERRIDDLLAEGQASFGRGDHQAAIDAWSRIFLIDIDHKEAARRIEEARRLKAEREREVEEVFHDAEKALAGGDEAAARRGFERVLEEQPGHDDARKRLEALEGGGLAEAIGEAASGVDVGGRSAETTADSEPLREEILVPPEPGQEAAKPPGDATPGRSLVATREGRAGRRFLLIGTAVLLLVAAVAYLVWDNRDSIFPNAEEVVEAPAVEEDAIARATRLHESGRTAMAINQLRRLPPTSPEYDEAQTLISRWEVEATGTPTPPTGEPVTEDPTVVRQRELVGQARAALDEDDYLTALSRLEAAAALGPLDGEAAELEQAVERSLAPVARLVELVRMGDHEQALPDLWRRHEAQPDDRVARHLIVEAYYRMGVRDLQRGDADAAAEHLAEAVALDPGDPLLARHRRFAEAYAQREKDLLYRIYVKYLPTR